METKKILITLSAILLMLVILIMGIMYFMQANISPAPSPTATQTISPEPTPISSNNVAILTNRPALFPQIDKKAETIKFFSKENGNLYSVKFNGQNEEMISSAVLPELVSASWSADGKKVIAAFWQQNQTRSYLYNYETGENQALSNNISKVVFSPSQDQIAYLDYDPAVKRGSIAIADPKTANPKNLFSTAITNWIISWPQSNLISLQTEPSGLSQGIIYAMDPTSGQYHGLIADLYGLQAKWSPNGNYFLYSATDADGHNLKLYLAKKDGSEKKLLPFATLADKCAFSLDNRTIFCAIMQNLPNDLLLPDDYLKQKYRSIDEFVEYNFIKDESVKLLALGESPFILDAANLILSPEEDYLFFINRRDNRLYSLKLQ